jgi:hypothetical protein
MYLYKEDVLQGNNLLINKLILAFVLMQSVAIGSLFVMVKNVDSQSKLLPTKIDMLVDASQDKPVINLDCPKCPDCPECKDYSEELKVIKKSIKSNGGKSGVYYYYSCQ